MNGLSKVRRLALAAIVATFGFVGCADDDVSPVADTSGTADVLTGDDVAAGDDIAAGDDVAAPTPIEADIATLQEWEGDDAVHDGEWFTVEGVATNTSGVIVSGRFLKFHLQDETGGVAVFTDTRATVEGDGYDGTVFADVFVRRGDRVRVTGVIGVHDGLVELRPETEGAVEILAHGETLPEPEAFDTIADLYAAGRAVQGKLVRVGGLQLADDAIWPAVGEKQKGIRFVDAASGPDRGDSSDEILADIYPNSGIPGSVAPAADFEMIGLCRISNETIMVFPRSIADINPIEQGPGGTISVTFSDESAASFDVDLSTLPAFKYDGRPAVLLADLLTATNVPDPRAFGYKTIASDGRQPFEPLTHVQVRQGMLVQSHDAEGQPIPDSVDSTFFEALELSHIYFLLDIAELRLFPVDATGPVAGEGSCEEGVNVWIQGEAFHVAFADLTTQSVELGGETVDAVPMTDVLSDNLLAGFTFDGFLTADDVRDLYDYELNGSERGPLATPEALAAGWLVPADGRVLFADGSAPEGDVPADFCHLVAKRRFFVQKDDTAVKLYLDDQAGAMDTIDTPDGDRRALPLSALVEASGLLEGEAINGFDYRLAAVDFPGGVRFPWSHGHMNAMYWWDEAGKTLSTNTTGDLQDDTGDTPWAGVASSGWSSVKALLYVHLEPNPDPENTLSIGMGDYTDPASCNGCHAKRGEVQIPVSCEQCH